MKFCPCGNPILIDEWEITRELCIFCEEKREEARQEAADIMYEYRKAKGEIE